MVSIRVFKSCPISFPNRITLVDLIELEMVDFNVILWMDWLYVCFACLYCRTRVVKFQLSNEPVLEWKGETQSLQV